MARNKIPEQKQDVFDPSRFSYIGAGVDEDVFKEKGPDVFSKTERIVSLVVHILFALSAIVLIVLSAVYGTNTKNGFNSWGIGGILGMVIGGGVLLLASLVSLFYHERHSSGKDAVILEKLNTAAYYLLFAGVMTAFGLLPLRQNVLSHAIPSLAFPYSEYTGLILIVIAWVLAIGGIVFECVFKDKYVKEIVQDALLAFVLYLPFFFYPILSKNYALSSMNTARPWLIMAPILLDIGVVFKAIGRTKRGFHSAFHVCAYGAVVMELATLLYCGIIDISTFA